MSKVAQLVKQGHRLRSKSIWLHGLQDSMLLNTMADGSPHTLRGFETGQAGAPAVGRMDGRALKTTPLPEGGSALVWGLEALFVLAVWPGASPFHSRPLGRGMSSQCAV